MLKHITSIIFTLFICVANLSAQENNPKVYDESIDPVAQIDAAIATAKGSGRFVICQVGGNWCPWCLRFARFITDDAEIKALIDEAYVYIHVNYPRRGTGTANAAAMAKLGNPSRFGFPVMVVLDGDGRILHTQDSSFLEEGQGYNKKKVMRFLNDWTPKAVGE